MDMDTEMESETPPSSPILGYSGPKDHQSLAGSSLIFCVCCKGEPKVGSHDHSFSPHSYILRRELISALKVLNPSDRADYPDKPYLYSMFGRRCDPTDLKQLKRLLLMCKKNINSLEILANSSSHYGYHYNPLLIQDDPKDISNLEPWKLRKDVCLFLNFFVSRIKYFQRRISTEDFESYFGGLKKSLCRAEAWSTSLKGHTGHRDGNECSSAMYHLFHLQLELRWSLLIIYGASVAIIDWFLQDLIHLAWYKYKQEGSKSLLDTIPYNCWCIKELWTMLYLLMKETNKNPWKIFEDSIRTFMDNLSAKNNEQNDVFFCLWLSTHLAYLQQYDLCGIYISGRRVRSENGYRFVNNILKQWASRGGKSAEMIKLTYSLLDCWGFDLDVVILFWNNWFPKIDKNVEVNNLDPYLSIEKWSNLVEFVTCQETYNSSEAVALFSSDTFLFFLKLLIGHSRIASAKDWRKIKSHLGMKLTRNNVGEFSEIGLLRVSSLYLALAKVTDDTLSMCERLIEVLDFGKQTVGRKKTILRAMATMILLVLRKNQNLHEISLCTTFMKTIDTLMAATSLESIKKDLVMIYLDLLEVLPNPSTPEFNESTLGRETLISCNLTMWLSTSGPNYVVRTLRVLNKLTAWIIDSKNAILLNFSSERDEMARRISERTMHFLTEAVILNATRVPSTDVEPMANVAADLTILNHGMDTFSKHFDHFALYERTCPEVSQYYVQRIYTFRESIDSAFTEVKWHQVWVRLVSLGCTIHEALSERVIGTGFKSTSNVELMKRFCSTCDDWSRGDIQNIFSPLAILVKSVVSNVLNNGATVSSVVTTSAIVLRTTKFDKVYIKGDMLSAGHRILDILVPPLVGNPPWEKLPAAVVSALKDNLFLFFEAVYLHPALMNDQYLVRKLQDIVTFALFGYVGGNLQGQINDEHPGIKILMYAEEHRIALVLDQIIPQLVKMTKDAKLTQRFVLVTMALRNQGLTSSVMKFLSGIISIYVNAATGSSMDMANACLNIIVYCCSFGLTPKFKLTLVASFEVAMEKDFDFKSRRFFDLCSALAKHSRPQVKKCLSIEIVPLMRNFVSSCEIKRGVGVDNVLRTNLDKLEKETRGFEYL